MKMQRLRDLTSILLCLLLVCTFCRAKHLREEESSALERFQRYLQIQTAHPNPSYTTARDYILSRAAEIGLAPKVIEFTKNKPVIILTWQGTKPSLPSILLNSHIDSVPAEEEKWIHPPFAAQKDKNGNIYARGSQDDKCIGMQYLEAIYRLKKNRFQPARTVHVSFVPDEEIGGFDGFRSFAFSDEFKALRVGFMLDEGQASPDEDFRVFNADRIPWRLIIRASGVPGHGSKLFDNSGSENLFKSLETVYRFRAAQLDMVKSGLRLPGEVVSVNAVYLKAGTPTPSGFVMNVQPSEAEAGFDIRLPPMADPQMIRDRISQEWAPSARNMTFELLANTPLRDVQGKPLLTIANSANPWWVVFEKAISAVGGSLKKPEVLTSTTDSRFVRQQGIPVFGFSPMSNTPILLHDHNEFLNERVYLRGIEVYTSIIESLSNYEGHSNGQSKSEEEL